MPASRTVENRHDRMELAAEAGYPKVSLGSVLAGVLVAYGAFAVLAAVAGGILSAMGVDIQAFSDNDWRDVGIASGVALGLILFLSYLFGGYVAGRMARRAGAANGVAVFVLGLLVAAGVGAAIGTQAGADGVVDNLRSIGVPTSGDQFRSIGTIAGAGSLLAMLVGSIIGGMNGERWHGKLLRRALDPTVGATAEAATATTPAVTHADAPEREADRPVEVRGEGGRHFAADDTRTTTLDEDLAGTDRDDDIYPGEAPRGSGLKQAQR